MLPQCQLSAEHSGRVWQSLLLRNDTGASDTPRGKCMVLKVVQVLRICRLSCDSGDTFCCCMLLNQLSGRGSQISFFTSASGSVLAEGTAGMPQLLARSRIVSLTPAGKRWFRNSYSRTLQSFSSCLREHRVSLYVAAQRL